MSTPTGLPDLLHRFVATPYGFEAVLHSTVVRFETNDEELLTVFRTQAEQLAGVLASGEGPWLWKVVRDYNVSGEGNDILLLDGVGLSSIFLGAGTAVAIDRDRRELLGFVARNVSAQYLLNLLLDVGRQHRMRHESESALVMPLHK